MKLLEGIVYKYLFPFLSNFPYKRRCTKIKKTVQNLYRSLRLFSISIAPLCTPIKRASKNRLPENFCEKWKYGFIFSTMYVHVCTRCPIVFITLQIKKAFALAANSLWRASYRRRFNECDEWRLAILERGPYQSANGNHVFSLNTDCASSFDTPWNISIKLKLHWRIVQMWLQIFLTKNLINFF